VTEVQQEYRIATQHAEPSLDYTPANLIIPLLMTQGTPLQIAGESIAEGFCRAPASMYNRYGKRIIEAAIVVLRLAHKDTQPGAGVLLAGTGGSRRQAFWAAQIASDDARC